MINKFIPAAAALFCLSGCATFTEEHAQSGNDDTSVEYVVEEPQDEGVVPVIHPSETVDIELEPDIEETEAEQAQRLADMNLWEVAADQFVFDVPNNKRVNSQRAWYLKHPNYMQRVSNRAKPFLHHIVNKITQYDMPMEMVLLPIVESAFDPFAYSHGSAAGMWQFIEGTGLRFGMRQSWWYDGRRDVIASTDGALAYLTYLHEYFDGNWLHALAAYNSGEGRVRSAIRKNKRLGKPTDFWSLDLPRETRAYVPKLLALADILKNHEQYDFAWPHIDNAPVIEVVPINSQIDLAFAADLAGLTLRELSALNPGFNRWATDPDGPHYLVVPASKADAFAQQLAEVDNKDRLNWQRHQVRRGDSLLKIANQYHTTVDIIKRVNELNSNMIRQGDHLMVPVALQSLDNYVFSNEQRLELLQQTERKGHQITHTVKSGDTFWDLARKYDTTSRSIAKWNGMAPKDTLRLGQKLVIWLDEGSERLTTVNRKVTYTVRRGDSLSRIANKFKVSVTQLKAWNDLSNKKYLQPGQKLTVIVDVTKVAS
nr:LysM peptidoglycan-binding domain-containing protein [Alteromonas oceanisediminis]